MASRNLRDAETSWEPMDHADASTEVNTVMLQRGLGHGWHHRRHFTIQWLAKGRASRYQPAPPERRYAGNDDGRGQRVKGTQVRARHRDAQTQTPGAPVRNAIFKGVPPPEHRREKRAADPEYVPMPISKRPPAPTITKARVPSGTTHPPPSALATPPTRPLALTDVFVVRAPALPPPPTNLSEPEGHATTNNNEVQGDLEELLESLDHPGLSASRDEVQDSSLDDYLKWFEENALL